MRKLGKVAIVGAAIGAGFYLAQKCMPKVSVFFAHEDDDEKEDKDVKDDVEKDVEDACGNCDCCDDCKCEIHAIPLSEAPAEVRAVVRAIADVLGDCHEGNIDIYGDEDSDEDDFDALYEEDGFELPNGKFEEPYFTL